MLLKSEMAIISALNALEEYKLSDLSGRIWVFYNSGPRYYSGGNVRPSEIANIVSHVKRGLCIVLSRSADQDYRPWEILSTWSVRDNEFNLTMHKEGEEEAPLNKGPSAIKSPMKITRVEWVHTDDKRKEETPEQVRDGDIIELRAEFENYEEGGSVSFVLYGLTSGSEKQLKKIDTECKSMKAAVEWKVEIEDCDKRPNLQFDCKAE